MNSSSIQRSMRCGAAALFLFAIAWLAALSIYARADAITDWDVIAFDAVEASGKTGPVTSCYIAMAHVAMHDALNAIDRRYEPYAYDAVGPRGASPEAAIAAAAHGVLIARIPLLHLASADSLIAGYGAKYRYNFWRPAPAIRNGANDGNPQTAGDPAWESYLETPNHPDYLSNHAVLCAAWAEILARFFGTDRFSFTMTSAKPYPGITRSFTSFSQSAQEAADSRVYAGVHFRSSCRDGLVIGRKIGAQAFKNFLRPTGDPYLDDALIDDVVASN